MTELQKLGVAMAVVGVVMAVLLVAIYVRVRSGR